MLKVVLMSLVLVPSLSFAKKPRMSDEAVSALEACGISRPGKGQRPSREERKKIKSCLSDAGIEAPRKMRRRDRSGSGDRDGLEG